MTSFETFNKNSLIYADICEVGVTLGEIRVNKFEQVVNTMGDITLFGVVKVG